MQDNAFLGQGWAFPPRFSQPGQAPLQLAGQPLVEQAMRLLLQTQPGERVMRPDFGSQLAGQLFDNCDAATRQQLAHSVQDALAKHEPRIDVNDVSVSASPEAGRLDIHIDYNVRQTNTRSNLVYPFYLFEATL